MRRFYQVTMLAAVLLLTLAAIGFAQEDANEIMKKSHINYYYAGDDGVAEVHMSIVDKRGKERVREFTMLRRDEADGGDQRYYTYFKKPSDVARLTFMVYKKADGNDLRWIYVPAVDLIKPISADDKNSSFVGSDFTYEDVSGRHWTEDNHTLKGDTTINGAPVWRIESIPKDPGYGGFARKLSYIDKSSYLPLREEYFNNKGEMTRIFQAEKIDTIDNIATVTVRSMQDLKQDRKTTVTFSSIKYNQGLTDDLFTERYLKNPPQQFIH
jgi:outer membrane lipoprotein-sorting protein